MRTSQRSRRGGRPPKAEPAVATAPSALDKVRSELWVLGKKKDCKYRGVIESCFGTFLLHVGNRAQATCDNPACKKRLRADTARPAGKRYSANPINRATVINPRRRRNYPATKGRINELRRDATFANRKLKPCKITTISDADLPTDHHRAVFAKARKTCLGEFYPRGKTQTCSDPCSDALAALGQYRRGRRWRTGPKGNTKTNSTRGRWRKKRKAAGLPYQ